MEIRLGMSPISWSNDDLPHLGGNTPLEICLRETRLAGFTGTETGGKFPKKAGALSNVLKKHDLSLVSGWYSGTLIQNDIKSEIKQITPQLTLFKEVGASVIVYGETHKTIQNQQSRPLSSRIKLTEFDVAEYGEKLTVLAEHCAEQGVPLTFHHHMGTAVETEGEINSLMANTGEAVGLLLDTGHLLFSGGNISSVISNHGNRINHVHTKDIRRQVMNSINQQKDSFLDCVLEGIFTVPGDGMINYDDVMQQLYEAGYEGWVIIEAEQDPAKANPLEYAKIGYNTLDKARKNAGYRLQT